ncbi:unnamed protein product [Boreogadus saida]
MCLCVCVCVCVSVRVCVCVLVCVSPRASAHVSVSVIMWIQWVEDNSTFHSTIPEAADLVVASIYTLFGVCSLLGNGMLLYVSYEKRPGLKPAEFFIINLAVSDLGMTLSLYPLAVTSSIYHRWLYGEAVCLLYAFCGVLFGICSLSTLTVLSTVCCLKVCYPLYGEAHTHPSTARGPQEGPCGCGVGLKGTCYTTRCDEPLQAVLKIGLF